MAYDEKMAVSMALLQPGSVLMSVAHGANKDHMDVQSLGCILWPAWHLRAMPLPRPHQYEWPNVYPICDLLESMKGPLL